VDAELFLDLYKQLEQTLKGRNSYYNSRYESPVIRFQNSSEGKAWRDELDTIRDIRNLLTHAPKVNGKYPVEPSEEIGAALQEILRSVEEPKKAIEYATWAEKILVTTPNSEVVPLMRMMELRGFSHVPVVKGEEVTGVFSTSTVFSYLIKNSYTMADDMKVSAFGDLLKINNHSTEFFDFASRDALYSEILEMFDTNYKKREKRLAIIFITRNGRRNEKLEGLITPWDVLGK